MSFFFLRSVLLVLEQTSINQTSEYIFTFVAYPKYSDSLILNNEMMQKMEHHIDELEVCFTFLVSFLLCIGVLTTL